MKTAELAAKKFIKLMGKNAPFIVYQYAAGHWGYCSMDSDNAKSILTSGGATIGCGVQIINHIVVE